jgi:crossover junction endodeoxyribonuclease RuvC/BirA family biotin operon repressor/biotin-[acetyl-CoA-carboxylase] ligase
MDRDFLIEKSRELRRNMTDVEILLWNKLRRKQLGVYFLRQHVFDNKYIVDFYCASKRLVIELDGGQHCKNEKDVERDKYLVSRGCKVLRFWNSEVKSNLDGGGTGYSKRVRKFVLISPLSPLKIKRGGKRIVWYEKNFVAVDFGNCMCCIGLVS